MIHIHPAVPLLIYLASQKRKETEHRIEYRYTIKSNVIGDYLGSILLNNDYGTLNGISYNEINKSSLTLYDMIKLEFGGLKSFMKHHTFLFETIPRIDSRRPNFRFRLKGFDYSVKLTSLQLALNKKKFAETAVFPEETKEAFAPAHKGFHKSRNQRRKMISYRNMSGSSERFSKLDEFTVSMLESFMKFQFRKSVGKKGLTLKSGSIGKFLDSIQLPGQRHKSVLNEIKETHGSLRSFLMLHRDIFFIARTRGNSTHFRLVFYENSKHISL